MVKLRLPERADADWLRAVFASTVASEVSHSDNYREVAGAHRAAVLLPFQLDEHDVIRLWMVRRGADLQHHPGQIALPGGREEDVDQSVSDIALREAQEELGIPPQQVEVLGRLSDQWVPVSCNLVTPIVGLLPEGLQPRILTEETAEILCPSLHELLACARERKYSRIFRQVENEPVQDWFSIGPGWDFDLPDATVWGMTANVLSELFTRFSAYCPN